MEVVLRVTAVYVFIALGLRLLGKREFGQLTPLELVGLLLIPELVSQALTPEGASLTHGLVGVATLLSLVFISSAIMHFSQRSQEVLAGRPALLVARGQMVETTINKERISPDEIFAEMHRAGLDRLEQVRWAILESDGRIAIVPNEPGNHLPVPSKKPRVS